MFKFVKGMLPACLKIFFIRNADVSERNTRQEYSLRTPFCHTELLKKTVKYQGVNEWNRISVKLDHKCSIHAFKRRLKKYFLDQMMND